MSCAARAYLSVLAEASDGYKAGYALPEFDVDFSDGVILVADGKNGEALTSKTARCGWRCPGRAPSAMGPPVNSATLGTSSLASPA
jgi:hypothetical protein